MRESAPLLYASDLFDLFLDTVKQIENVSEHFSYTEEYVLARPYLWMVRKHNQLNRSQYERRRYLQADAFNARLAAEDFMHNKGKFADKYLLDDYDEVLKKSQGTSSSSGNGSKGTSFAKEEVDPFAFMPREMKERLKQKA